jgi:hypothetical protein
MTSINNAVFWKTQNEEERVQMIVFRRNLDRILNQSQQDNTKIVKNPDQDYQLHLQQAMIYAKSQMLQEESKEVYDAMVKNEDQTAYTIAVADFLNAPDIQEVDLTNYSGKIGDTIRVRATDDFKVAQVIVSIIDVDGSVVESGDAIQQGDSNDWIYYITAHNLDFDGDKIVIQASDLPGNLSQKEQDL